MGVALSRGSVDFEVVCKTGDVKGAGTDSNVYLVIVDEDGGRSRNILLDCNWRNDFEQGNVDTFTIRNVPTLGKVKTVNLWRDSSGVNDDWFVESLIVRQYTVGKPSGEQVRSNSSDDAATAVAQQQNKNTGEGVVKDMEGREIKEPQQQQSVSLPTLRRKRPMVYEYPFPINRWIEPNRTYVFTIYDSVLPQYDVNPEQRKVEMDEKRERYGLKGNCEDGPKQVNG